MTTNATIMTETTTWDRFYGEFTIANMYAEAMEIIRICKEDLENGAEYVIHTPKNDRFGFKDYGFDYVVNVEDKDFEEKIFEIVFECFDEGAPIWWIDRTGKGFNPFTRDYYFSLFKKASAF